MAPTDRAGLLYVGDHRDHDLLAGCNAGVRTALIRRGPWGYLWHDEPKVRTAAAFVASGLTELVEMVLAERAGSPEVAPRTSP
ncbi:hypothetical protein GCM10027610_105840 [Dactylosporangium cerinum]